MSLGQRPFVHVVAAVLIDAADRVLIAQRPAGKHLAGGWEFPGGKLEPGEDRRAGLARELREELGIELGGAGPRPLIRVTHHYPDRSVLLDTWVVRNFRGEPRGLDGQALRWCKRAELRGAELLPADAPIVGALSLPERLTRYATPGYVLLDAADFAPRAISARRSAGRRRMRGALCASPSEAVRVARGGADFLVMRAPLPSRLLTRLCRAVPIPIFARETTLRRAWSLGATGTNELA